MSDDSHDDDLERYLRSFEDEPETETVELCQHRSVVTRCDIGARGCCGCCGCESATAFCPSCVQRCRHDAVVTHENLGLDGYCRCCGCGTMRDFCAVCED